jgi:hypothetical protein
VDFRSEMYDKIGTETTVEDVEKARGEAIGKEMDKGMGGLNYGKQDSQSMLKENAEWLSQANNILYGNGGLTSQSIYVYNQVKLEINNQNSKLSNIKIGMNDFMKNYSWDYKAINLDKELAKWGVGKEDEIKAESTSESINKLVAKEKLNNEELVYYENLIADKLTIGKFTASNDLEQIVKDVNLFVDNSNKLGMDTPEKRSAYIHSLSIYENANNGEADKTGWNSIRGDNTGGKFGLDARDGGTKGHFGNDKNYIKIGSSQYYDLPVLSAIYGKIVNVGPAYLNTEDRKKYLMRIDIEIDAEKSKEAGILIKNFPTYRDKDYTREFSTLYVKADSNIKKGSIVEPGTWLGTTQNIRGAYDKYTPQHTHDQIGFGVGEEYKKYNNPMKDINYLDPKHYIDFAKAEATIKNNLHPNLTQTLDKIVVVMPNFFNKPVHSFGVRAVE